MIDYMKQAKFAVARRRALFTSEAAVALERCFQRPDDLVLRGEWRVASDRAAYWTAPEATERYARMLFDFAHA